MLRASPLPLCILPRFVSQRNNLFTYTCVSYRSIQKKKKKENNSNGKDRYDINELLTQWYTIQLISKFTKRLIRREGEKRIFSQTQYSMITIDKILSITFALYCLCCVHLRVRTCVLFTFFDTCGYVCPEAVSLSVWSHHNKTLVVYRRRTCFRKTYRYFYTNISMIKRVRY